MKLPDFFQQYRSEVDAQLHSVLDNRTSPLYDLMRYHLGWQDREGRTVHNESGKALRPVLCLLACEAVGGKRETALPVAASLELLHNFSLIHDDIQDNDTERRHRATVWSIWGKPQAINAGTAMRILANRALAGLIERGVALQDYARLQTLLDETTLKLIEGQYLDIDFEDRFDITTEDYLTMISGKTVALFACALEAGAIAGGGSRQSIEDLHSCGEYLGYAFQIRDDVLGIWGEQEQTGKPHASDILQKKKSLPIIYAFEYAGQKDRDTLQSLYNNQSLSEAQVETVLQILERTNARKEVGRIEQQYSNTLQELVNKADISEAAREAFNEITAFLMQREY